VITAINKRSIGGQDGRAGSFLIALRRGKKRRRRLGSAQCLESFPEGQGRTLGRSRICRSHRRFTLMGHFYGTNFRSLGYKANRRLRNSDLRCSRFITLGMFAERPAKSRAFRFRSEPAPSTLRGAIWSVRWGADVWQFFSVRWFCVPRRGCRRRRRPRRSQPQRRGRSMGCSRPFFPNPWLGLFECSSKMILAHDP